MRFRLFYERKEGKKKRAREVLRNKIRTRLVEE
jgi:hypothetical protein